MVCAAWLPVYDWSDWQSWSSLSESSKYWDLYSCHISKSTICIVVSLKASFLHTVGACKVCFEAVFVTAGSEGFVKAYSVVKYQDIWAPSLAASARGFKLSTRGCTKHSFRRLKKHQIIVLEWPYQSTGLKLTKNLWWSEMSTCVNLRV